jgi:hypothetical protein
MGRTGHLDGIHLNTVLDRPVKGPLTEGYEIGVNPSRSLRGLFVADNKSLRSCHRKVLQGKKGPPGLHGIPDIH